MYIQLVTLINRNTEVNKVFEAVCKCYLKVKRREIWVWTLCTEILDLELLLAGPQLTAIHVPKQARGTAQEFSVALELLKQSNQKWQGNFQQCWNLKFYITQANLQREKHQNMPLTYLLFSEGQTVTADGDVAVITSPRVTLTKSRSVRPYTTPTQSTDSKHTQLSMTFSMSNKFPEWIQMWSHLQKSKRAKNSKTVPAPL